MILFPSLRTTNFLLHLHGQEFLSQQDLFDQAASYIKQRKERIEELKSRKRLLSLRTADETNNSIRNSVMHGLNLPILRFRDLGCSFEIVLISGHKKKFMLHEVISILEGGGAEVVTANLANNGINIFLTLHAQVIIDNFFKLNTHTHTHIYTF